jgi:hypothetical protein
MLAEQGLGVHGNHKKSREGKSYAAFYDSASKTGFV